MRCGNLAEFTVNIPLGSETWDGKLDFCRVLCELLGGAGWSKYAFGGGAFSCSLCAFWMQACQQNLSSYALKQGH